ncbi:MAG: hypothetical protein HXS51_11640 [Theionarchaea archaeon]|nr:hypothetical protein [Theionarchaea archaeon]
MSKEDATLEYHAAVVYDSYHDVRKGYDQDVKSASVPPLSAAEKKKAAIINGTWKPTKKSVSTQVRQGISKKTYRYSRIKKTA